MSCYVVQPFIQLHSFAISSRDAYTSVAFDVFPSATNLSPLGSSYAIMKRELLPSQRRLLSTLGEQLRYARLRRDLTTVQIAERAGIARTILVKIEKGDEGVALGQYFRVMLALGLGNDIVLIARDDELGRKLQDAKLEVKERASKK